MREDRRLHEHMKADQNQNQNLEDRGWAALMVCNTQEV